MASFAGKCARQPARPAAAPLRLAVGLAAADVQGATGLPQVWKGGPDRGKMALLFSPPPGCGRGWRVRGRAQRSPPNLPRLERRTQGVLVQSCRCGGYGE